MTSEMEVASPTGFSIEFENAVIFAVPEGSAPVRPATVGWYLGDSDPDRPDLRFRYSHIAPALMPRFGSLRLTGLVGVREAIDRIEAIIVAGCLDASVVQLVAMARARRIPVFLDLSDDPITPSPTNKESGTNLLNFLAIGRFLAGAAVSSAELADRIESYAVDYGLSGLQVHVVPDVAETWTNFRATVEQAGDLESSAEPDEPRTRAPLDPRHVIWFGSGIEGDSDLFALKPHFGALRTIHREIPLELVIVGDSEPIFRALVEDCGFPTRFVPYVAPSLYRELAQSDVALLPVAENGPGAVESSRRLLQALGAGVPVITRRASSNVEFQDALFLGRVADALRTCLGPSRDRVVPAMLEAAGPVLTRYTPDRVGAIWSGLLEAAIARRGADRLAAAASKILFVVEAGDTPSVIEGVLAAARKHASLDYELLVATEALEGDPAFGPVLRQARTIPTFINDPGQIPLDLLPDYAAIVVERPSAPAANRLIEFASEMSLPSITSHQAANGGLGRFAAPARAPASVPSKIVAGPYKERLNADGTADWAFIVDEKGRGWILDAICREIGSRQPDSWQVAYHPSLSAPAKNLFFSHYALLLKYDAEGRLDRLVDGTSVFVWYTHPREEDPVAVAKLLLAFEKVTKVIFACESNRRVWLDRGLAEEKAVVVLGAADPELFRSHERGRGLVGLSSSFYERKNPDCLLELVKLLPHRDFLLLGRKWNQYARFEELRALANFSYRSAPYREYPAIYETFDVFLSMSTLEGGPIPLVEAMMSNAVPVASRTGFAPDLIQHGKNGFIFDLDASAETIAEMIEDAFTLPGNVRETVERYSWDNFSRAIVNLAQ